jgi:DNA-binding HxlR family transcriptional regulator
LGRYAGRPGVTFLDVPAASDKTIVDHETCSRADASLARAFDFLGKRWNAAVLGSLNSGPAGFREISRGIDGVSDSMLSNRLSCLTAAGLITRTVCDGPPVSVAYALTDAGRALMPALGQIALWAEEHLPQ